MGARETYGEHSRKGEQQAHIQGHDFTLMRTNASLPQSSVKLGCVSYVESRRHVEIQRVAEFSPGKRGKNGAKELPFKDNCKKELL